MTKQEAKAELIKKQQLNEARRIYKRFRSVNPLFEVMYYRFDLFPVFDEIELDN